MSDWWMVCPNDPPCPHGGIFHDIEEYHGDGTDTCCIEGCDCRGPSAPKLVTVTRVTEPDLDW